MMIIKRRNVNSDPDAEPKFEPDEFPLHYEIAAAVNDDKSAVRVRFFAPGVRFDYFGEPEDVAKLFNSIASQVRKMIREKRKEQERTDV